MALRFFADHCVPRAILLPLRNAGHEVLRVKDFIPPDSPDQTVIAKAQELNALLLTLNGDFSDIVSYPPRNFQGIIALQVKNHPEVIPQIMAQLMSYLSMHPDQNEYQSRLFIVEAHRIRIRK